jgi:dTDP-4-amino-4,6-dideoxygalactose transaminase
MEIKFYKHNIDSIDRKNLLKVLNSNFLTTGDVVLNFEKKFADYLGNKHAVGLMSCTHALYLALIYFGVKKDDEIITTPLTYTATADAIEYCGAKPVFVDVEEGTGNIDADLIEKAITKRTKVILPVHLFGQMADMRKIRKVADKYNLKIVEDSAHCIEGKRDRVRPGQLGDIACFSFYATKNITCGEGGAISTNEEKIYKWFKKASSHGLSKDVFERTKEGAKKYDKEFLGFKSNMSNIQAALLLHQLDKIEQRLKQREKVWKNYDVAFKKIDKVKKFKILRGVKHARYWYTIMIDPTIRDSFMLQLRKRGIDTAINYEPVTKLSYYKNKYGFQKGNFKTAEKIGSSILSLPFYPKLKKKEVNYIANAIKEILGKMDY